MKPIRLLVADDHTIVRNALNSIFECDEGFEIIGEANDGKDLVEKAIELKPDVIVSDLKMPYVSGIAAARIIKQKAPFIKIIILTAYDEKNDVREAVEAGVDGYMIKDTLPDELIKAVELVYKGYTCIFHSDIREIVRDNHHKEYEDGVAGPDDLTHREMEVYRLVAQNYSNLEIAQKLYISEATVKSHVSKILKKTGQPNRAQAVLYGLARGIINSKQINIS